MEIDASLGRCPRRRRPTVQSADVETPSITCALCGEAVGDVEPAHAVRGKVVCQSCRRLVLASEPRRVLPYAGPAGRRRRWLWTVVAAAVVVIILSTSLLLINERRVAIERARVEEMRALAAEARAKAAADALSRPVQTRPAE